MDDEEEFDKIVARISAPTPTPMTIQNSSNISLLPKSAATARCQCYRNLFFLSLFAADDEAK
jgi:hypothetical protein